MKKKRSLKGSAILWAVCTLLIFMVVVSAVIVMSQFYSNRELDVLTEKQAELYAKSGADIIVSELINEQGINENGGILTNSNLTESTPLVIDMTLDNGRVCTVTISKLSSDILTVSSEAINANITAIVACCVSAELDVEKTRLSMQNGDPDFWKYKWVNKGYYTY